LDDRVLPFSGCYWWTSDMYPRDESMFIYTLALFLN